MTVCKIVSTFCVSFRLPIVQGGSAAFFSPIFAVLALPEYSCQIGAGVCVVDTVKTDNDIILAVITRTFDNSS